MIVVLSVTEMRWDDLGSWMHINGCSSRAAAAAPIVPRSLCAEYSAGDLPGRSTIDGLLFMSVTAFMHMLGPQRHCHWQDLCGFGHTAQEDPQTSCVLCENAGD